MTTYIKDPSWQGDRFGPGKWVCDKLVIVLLGIDFHSVMGAWSRESGKHQRHKPLSINMPANKKTAAKYGWVADDAKTIEQPTPDIDAERRESQKAYIGALTGNRFGVSQ